MWNITFKENFKLRRKKLTGEMITSFLFCFVFLFVSLNQFSPQASLQLTRTLPPYMSWLTFAPVSDVFGSDKETAK
jgi:tryptophan-rich sensory protein